MDLGKRILQARQEAGLSQKQLCGEEITRNMLSQIEHGTAMPSLSTLQYLSARLGKPIGFFLDDQAPPSKNHRLMDAIRQNVDKKAWETALELLKNYSKPDAVYDREYGILRWIVTLSLAEIALDNGQIGYARELLSLEQDTCLLSSGLEHRRILLKSRLPRCDVQALAQQLPSLDEELILRARAALAAKDPRRAGQLLDAAENQDAARWNLLRGDCHLQLKQWTLAIPYYQKAELEFPRECNTALETCYREIRDYQMAYLYACKLREL